MNKQKGSFKLIVNAILHSLQIKKYLNIWFDSNPLVAIFF